MFRPFLWSFPGLLGRRVCGVGVKAQRPQAKPRTNGLEADTVLAMLVKRGRRDVGKRRRGEAVAVCTRDEIPCRKGMGRVIGCRSSIRPAGGGMV